MSTDAPETAGPPTADLADNITAPGGPRRHWLLPTLLGAIVVGLLAASAVVGLRPDGGIDQGMVVAARQQATNFFSLDHRHAEADVDKVLALATGDFKEEYSARRAEIVKGVLDKKLVVTATIPEGGTAVEFHDGDRGQVLVAVDVTTADASGRPGTEDHYRTRLLLTRVEGRWLVSGLNQVG